MALILSGDTGPSFVQSAAQPVGTVLQLTNSSTTTSYVSTTSNTPSEVSSSLRVTITPSSASNKILVQYILNPVSASSSTCGCAIYRSINGGAYSKVQSGNGNEAYRNAGGSTIWSNLTMTFLDSPATTSTCIYTLYFWTSSGTFGINDNGNGTFGLAMEIKQ